MENIIQKLSESFDSLNAVQQQGLQGSAQHLFYLLAQLIDGDVKRCHPAIQFFSSGVEKLGKVLYYFLNVTVYFQIIRNDIFK